MESEGMRWEEVMWVCFRDVVVIVCILGKGKVKKWLVEVCMIGEVSKILREGGCEWNVEKFLNNNVEVIWLFWIKIYCVLLFWVY